MNYALNVTNNIDLERYSQELVDFIQTYSTAFMVGPIAIIVVWLAWLMCTMSGNNRAQKLFTANEKLRYRNKLLLRSNIDLQKKVDVYSEAENAHKNYSSAYARKELSNISLLLMKKESELVDERRRNKELEEFVQRQCTTLRCLRRILKDPQYTNSERLIYDDDGEWTLTKLKERAKELGINMLSKYKWSGRRALAITIRVTEQLDTIRQLVNSSMQDHDNEHSGSDTG